MPENHNNEHFLLKKNGTADDATVEVGIKKPEHKWTKYQIIHLAITLTLLVVCIVLIVIYVIKLDVLNRGKKDTENTPNHSQLCPSSQPTQTNNSANKNVPVCLSPECISLASQILSYGDQNVNPCQDFYQYSCGGWQKKAYIPDSKSAWDTFWDLTDANDKLLKKSFDANKPNKSSPAEVKIFNLYSSCKNTETIDKIGLKPLMQLITELGSCKALNASWDEKSWDLTENLAKIHGVFPPIAYMETDSPLFDMRVVVDITNSAEHIIKVSQPRNEKLSIDGNGNVTVLDSYTKAMNDAMTLLGGRNANHYMKDVLALEKQLRKVSVPMDQYRKVATSRQKITIKELTAATNNSKLDWLRYFRMASKKTGLKITESTAIATQSLIYFEKMADILDKMSKTTLSNYFIWSLVKEFKDDLPKTMTKIFFEMKKASTGVATEDPRWRKCLRKVENSMGMALGAMLVKEKINESDKKEIGRMINSIKDSFLDIVKESEWMDEETKMRAIKKGKAIIGNIAYPSFIQNTTALANFYKGVKLEDKTYFNNILQLQTMKKHKNMMKLASRVDRQEWEFPPSMVNAFYDAGRNKMVFMAGILQSPFFNRNAPKPINYGGIGMVMGHELSHAFDDQGRQFDENGNLKPWWTDQSTKAYKQKVKCLKNQYSKYSIYGISINENQTIGENIADNGGIKTAYKAYKKWVQTNGPPKKLPGLNMTDDQLFFLASAQIWCSVEKQSFMKSSLLYGVHSPAIFRVRGSLSNMNEFAKAYKCPISSTMNPKKKCKFW